MRRWAWLAVLVFFFRANSLALSSPQPPQAGEELQITDNEVGRYGGSLVVAQGAEPKTLNPVTAADARSREVIGRMMADLIHINRDSQKTEPALAKSWTTSRDGRVFTLKLRHGLRFSDGHPFDADDVRVFLPGLSGREHPFAATRPSHRGRKAARGAENRSVHGALHSGPTLCRRRTHLRQSGHDAAPPSGEALSRRQLRAGLERQHARPRRSPAWDRFA